MAIFLARQKGSGGIGNLQTKTFTAGTSSATYTPDSGYVGFDEVTVDPTPSETKTQAAGTSNIDVTPTNGKLLSKVTITPQQHSESFTPTANLQGASGNANDMGASHNKRYINTSGMIIPSGNKSITSNGTGIDVSSYSTASVSVTPSIQSKSAGTQYPSANWSGSTTGSVTINKDSGYDGMSSVTFNVPMIRDGEMLKYSTTTAPGTIYKGDTSYSNSKSLLRVAPYKDGMAYTGSYLYVDPSEAGLVAPSGTRSISSNGTYDVSSYASVSVSVPTGTTPSGTKSITSNGTYDISSYAYVSVNVPTGGGTINTAEVSLWTNSSPSSTFAAQKITLSKSILNVSCMRLYWRANTSNNNVRYIEFDAYSLLYSSGDTTFPEIVLGSINSNGVHYTRRANYYSGTQIEFKAAHQYGTTTASNGHCIPTKVVEVTRTVS